MTTRRVPRWLHHLLEFSASHRYYPAVIGALAFTSTATFAFPFAVVLIPAVLLAPRRWLLLGLVAGLTSGLGGGVLVEMFQFLGREFILERYPQLVDSQGWQIASVWLHEYGLFALAVIAASPIPQTPGVFLYSLAEPSTLGAMLAIGCGKTVKYVALAWLTERYPSRFVAYR